MGSLILTLGPMFSGKTTYLLSQIAKISELNYSILYINIKFRFLLLAAAPYLAVSGWIL